MKNLAFLIILGLALLSTGHAFAQTVDPADVAAIWLFDDGAGEDTHRFRRKWN